MKINEVITPTLPPDVVAQFEQLSDMQRGGPEIAMTRVQFANIGGVLNPVVEHVGDIINRMTQMRVIEWGLDAAAEKIEKTYRWLTHPYGFAKEFEQNIQQNAEYKGVPSEDFRHKVDQALAIYAHEHEKLPVYNAAQFLARQASISLGQKQWDMAVQCLDTLRGWCGRDDWPTKALEFRKSPEGKLLSYPYR